MEISIINVRPEAQHHGNAARLLIDLTNRFEPQLHPTAYVLDENWPALNYFGDRGFRFSPPVAPPGVSRQDAQTPRPLKDYFGPGTRPAELWRLEAAGAEQLRVDLFDIAAAGGYSIPTVTQVDQSVLNNRLAMSQARRDS